LTIKYYGSEWINLVLKWYFVTTGVGSVWAVSVISDRSTMPFGAHGGISDIEIIGSLRGWRDTLAIVREVFSQVRQRQIQRYAAAASTCQD
jgi:hypothetical protein